MENIFNSPLLKKLQDLGQKLGSSKFISALQAGMMSTMSLIMVGAVCQIICSVGVMLSLFTADSAIYGYIYTPYNFTMNLLGIWITANIAFNYAKNLKLKSPLTHAIDATIIFVLVCSNWTEGGLTTTFLGATGMFVGFVVAGIVVRIEKFCLDKNIRIPMPEVCPPSLVNAFAAIIPLAINVIIFQGLNIVLSVISGGMLNVPIAIMAILSAPLGALLSTPGMFILCAFALILWCFGIHGTMIVYPIIMASMIEASATNAALHAAGEPLVFYPVILFGLVGALGGSGNTWALCIMGLKAKSEQIRAVSKVGLIPGWFGINEPVAFGMPIMYNPILCIPYVLNTMVILLIYYFAYSAGIIMVPWIAISALMPIGFSAYLSTLNIFNSIFQYLMLIPSAIVWYPFFKVYDNQLYAKECEAKKALEA